MHYVRRQRLFQTRSHAVRFQGTRRLSACQRPTDVMAATGLLIYFRCDSRSNLIQGCDHTRTLECDSTKSAPGFRRTGAGKGAGLIRHTDKIPLWRNVPTSMLPRSSNPRPIAVGGQKPFVPVNPVSSHLCNPLRNDLKAGSRYGDDEQGAVDWVVRKEPDTSGSSAALRPTCQSSPVGPLHSSRGRARIYFLQGHSCSGTIVLMMMPTTNAAVVNSLRIYR